MRFFAFLLFLFFLLIPFEIQAQIQFNEIPEHFVGDLRYTLKWTPLAIAGATALTASLVYSEKDTEWQVSTKGELMGKSSEVLSNVGAFLPYTIPFGLWFSSWIWEKGAPQRTALNQTAEEMFEALFFTMGTTLILKYSVGRTRPDGTSQSFPSAHASSNFAVAGILVQDTPWYIGIPSLMFASAVSLSRIDQQAHFASDVIAGAGIGLFYATAVHQFHQENPSRILSHLAPQVTDHHGLSLTWVDQF